MIRLSSITLRDSTQTYYKQENSADDHLLRFFVLAYRLKIRAVITTEDLAPMGSFDPSRGDTCPPGDKARAPHLPIISSIVCLVNLGYEPSATAPISSSASRAMGERWRGHARAARLGSDERSLQNLTVRRSVSVLQASENRRKERRRQRRDHDGHHGHQCVICSRQLRRSRCRSVNVATSEVDFERAQSIWNTRTRDREPYLL
jgi:hypothetical protein